MAKAHKHSASHGAAFPSVPKSQETMDPMIPARAAAALPTNLARARPRACRCFFTHTLTSPFSGGLGAGDGTSGILPPPVSASTSADIAMPIAVRMLTIVIPCSRKSVRIRSASVSSSWRSRLMVSRTRFTWDRRAAVFVQMASNLACLSSSMSESSPLSLLIRSRISSWILVSVVSVSFRRFRAKWFSTADFRSSTSDSFARLFTSSSLILVIASLTPVRSLVACVTHATSICGSSIVFKAVSTSPVVPMTSLVAPERSFSSIDSIFFGRLSSAFWSVSTASFPSRETPDL